MAALKHWIYAARPRTLPLALASIGLGSFLAARQGAFEWQVFVLASVTTVLLQVLSNLANDYGDTINGADFAGRTGPSRVVQAGLISPIQMRSAIILFAFLALVCGTWLIYSSLGKIDLVAFVFFILGLLAIGAAIRYTVGENPYGYAGLGDISVLIFFGLLGVLGTFFLHAGSLHGLLLLPALCNGLLATAVLNLNNIRDIVSDRQAGKRSIPVRYGRKAGVRYHVVLIVVSIGLAVLYTLLSYTSPWQWLFLLSLPLFVINIMAVRDKASAEALDPYLRQLALSSLLFTVLFGIGLLA